MVNLLVWLLAHLYAQPVDHYWNGFVQNCIHFQILTNSSNEWIFSHLLYNIIQFCCNIWNHNHPYTSERKYWDPALLSSICKAIWSVQKSWNSVSAFYIKIRNTIMIALSMWDEGEVYAKVELFISSNNSDKIDALFW